jgi:hypothetical protein
MSCVLYNQTTPTGVAGLPLNPENATCLRGQVRCGVRRQFFYWPYPAFVRAPSESVALPGYLKF